MFAPEDLEIVKGSPGVRRRFLDMEIGQVQPSYLYHLQQYQKVLIQRNNFLKKTWGASSEMTTMLEIWNEQLAEHGVKIVIKKETIHKEAAKMGTAHSSWNYGGAGTAPIEVSSYVW